jgi:transposase
MTGIMVQTKLQFQAVLDQVFPEYKGVFGDLYAEVSLKTLQTFPTSVCLKSWCRENCTIC